MSVDLFHIQWPEVCMGGD